VAGKLVNKFFELLLGFGYKDNAQGVAIAYDVYIAFWTKAL
jgi:hypothetical protein